MMKEINRSNIRILREEMQNALDAVAKKHGVQIKFGNASFTPSMFTIKTEVAIQGGEGEVVGKEAEDFKLYCMGWGFEPSDLGKEFDYLGDVFKIVGAKPRSKKYPIIGENIKTGKRFKFNPRNIKLD